MCPLGLIDNGEVCEIIKLRFSAKEDNHLLNSKFNFSIQRLEELGLRQGSQLEMLNNNKDGAILVKVENSRIALPHKVSMKIFVRRK